MPCLTQSLVASYVVVKAAIWATDFALLKAVNIFHGKTANLFAIR
jgi:hypothetical protein